MKASEQPVAYTASENGRWIFPLYPLTLVIAICVIAFVVLAMVITALLYAIGGKWGVHLAEFIVFVCPLLWVAFGCPRPRKS